jgi:hypothetical protein
MIHRFIAALVVAALIPPLFGVTIAIAQSTPAANTLDTYPFVPTTLTDSEIQLGSDPRPAGYVRLIVTNTGQDPDGIGLVAIPEGNRSIH